MLQCTACIPVPFFPWCFCRCSEVARQTCMGAELAWFLRQRRGGQAPLAPCELQRRPGAPSERASVSSTAQWRRTPPVSAARAPSCSLPGSLTLRAVGCCRTTDAKRELFWNPLRVWAADRQGGWYFLCHNLHSNSHFLLSVHLMLQTCLWGYEVTFQRHH